MKKLLLCGLLLGVMGTVASPAAFGWMFRQHQNLAERIDEDPSMSSQIAYNGWDDSMIQDAAYWGDWYMRMDGPYPWHDAQWTEIATWSAFQTKWMYYRNAWGSVEDQEFLLGCLLHNIADTAMPAGHNPGSEICPNSDNHCAGYEFKFETATTESTPPAWPNPPYYRSDWWNYDAYEQDHRSYTLNLAQSFSDHIHKWWCNCGCCMTAWIYEDYARGALKQGWNVAWIFAANYTCY